MVIQTVTTTDIAEVVKVLRERRYELRRADGARWNQRAVAARLGWSQSQLSAYETGHDIPRPETVARWAADLGVPFAVTFSIATYRSQP